MSNPKEKQITCNECTNKSCESVYSDFECWAHLEDKDVQAQWQLITQAETEEDS